jgi:nicotinamidase/pyrazinamidase
MTRALLVVDAINTFMPGGELPIPNADKIIPYINQAIHYHTYVIWINDHHGEGSVEFTNNGGKWPPHARTGTNQVALAPGLLWGTQDFNLRKGTRDSATCHSAFFDSDGVETDLPALIREEKISSLLIAGVATEICIKATVLDAIKLGLSVGVLFSGIAGLERESSALALMEMMEAGANIIVDGAY